MTQLEKLQIIDTLISWQSTCAINDYIFLDYIDRHFNQRDQTEKEHLFKTNPANTFSYLAILAKANQALVDMVETLTNIEKVHGPLPDTIRHKWDLVNHRDFISHPGMITWKHSAMQTFTKENKQHSDNKAKLVWKLKKSIETAINDLGGKSENSISLRVPEVYIEMISLIWKYSIKDGIFQPPNEEIKASLITFFQEYEKQILNA